MHLNQIMGELRQCCWICTPVLCDRGIHLVKGDTRRGHCQSTGKHVHVRRDRGRPFSILLYLLMESTTLSPGPRLLLHELATMIDDFELIHATRLRFRPGQPKQGLCSRQTEAVLTSKNMKLLWRRRGSTPTLNVRLLSF